MKQFGPKQKKVAALAILVLLLALACVAIAFPIWLLNQHYDEALEDATSRLGRYSKIVGTRDALQKQVDNGLERTLVGFELLGRGIPREGYDVENAQGEKIGSVTSGTMSVVTGKGIALSLVEKDKIPES